jgi:hypothetical protein
MRWHAERKKPKDDDDDDQEDMILRHPSDASQWKALDIECPEFGNDPRNVRLGVSTDGLNPFGSQSSTHSVVGMTSGVCQGQCYLSAGVPGISTTLSQEDRLCPKGRLRQQPSGDSTEESQSRAKTTRFLQRPFRRKWPGPDKIDSGEGRA